MSFLAGPLDGKEQMVSRPKNSCHPHCNSHMGCSVVRPALEVLSMLFQTSICKYMDLNVFLLFVNIDGNDCLLSGCELLGGSELSPVGVSHPLPGAST